MKRYMYKQGDRRVEYEIGKNVVVKWNVSYRILNVKYNPQKDVTVIILEKS